MSRSGYTSDYDDQWQLVMWRGAVASAIRGKRGQAFLTEMLVALDAMPNKRLIAESLRTQDGEVCALGAVAMKRGADVSAIDPEEQGAVAHAFGIPRALACEIMWMNDEAYCRGRETPEERWTSMRRWIVDQLKIKPPLDADAGKGGVSDGRV